MVVWRAMRDISGLVARSTASAARKTLTAALGSVTRGRAMEAAKISGLLLIFAGCLQASGDISSTTTGGSSTGGSSTSTGSSGTTTGAVAPNVICNPDPVIWLPVGPPATKVDEMITCTAIGGNFSSGVSVQILPESKNWSATVATTTRKQVSILVDYTMIPSGTTLELLQGGQVLWTHVTN